MTLLQDEAEPRRSEVLSKGGDTVGRWDGCFVMQMGLRNLL